MKFFAVLAAFLLLGGSLPALAGIVKYRMPDGREGYATEDLVPAGAIVESPDYEPAGSLSTGSGPSPIVEPEPYEQTPAGKKDLEERRTDLAKERWARKAKDAREELASAEKEYKRWHLSCGGDEDERSLYEAPEGCSDYERSQLEAALAALKEAEDWSDDGLYDACRRDELCLPGFIR